MTRLPPRDPDARRSAGGARPRRRPRRRRPGDRSGGHRPADGRGAAGRAGSRLDVVGRDHLGQRADPGPRHDRGPGAADPDARRRTRRQFAAPRGADGTAVGRRRPHLRRRRPAARHRVPLRRRDGSRSRRAHRPFPHLRRRAVLVRLRLRLVRDDRLEQRDLRRHPRAQAALLPAPRRLPLRQHPRRRSVALPRRLEPRAALAAPVGALSRGTDRLRLRRPRLRPRRCGRHVGDEGGGAAGLPRAGAPLSDAVVGGAARRARRRSARPHRPGVHGRPRPLHRHRHAVGADAAALGRRRQPHDAGPPAAAVVRRRADAGRRREGAGRVLGQLGAVDHQASMQAPGRAGSRTPASAPRSPAPSRSWA